MVFVLTPPFYIPRVLHGPLRPATWTWFALALAGIDMVLLLRIFRRRDFTTGDSEDLPGIESDKPIDDPKEATRDSVILAQDASLGSCRHPEASVPADDRTDREMGQWQVVINETRPQRARSRDAEYATVSLYLVYMHGIIRMRTIYLHR